MNPEGARQHLSKLHDTNDLRRFLVALGYNAKFDEEYFLPSETKGDVRAQGLLDGDLEIVAAHGDFPIFYGRLRGKLSLADERTVVERLLADRNPYALFVFSDANQKNWRFINVKADLKTPARKRVFRRFSVDTAQPLGRTTLERLGSIDISGRSLEPLETQILHERAFDVEAVTRDFYLAYEGVFARVKANISAKAGIVFDENARHEWTQRLFNRLMFLRFLERKSWLEFDGSTDYLRALWKAANKSKENFLDDRLYYAFFWGLGFPNDTDFKDTSADEELRRKRGDVPFLNGGLFEETKVFDAREAIRMSNELAGEILDFLDGFNFTISESTPLDVEVAVDPEMLGKVFEELVTGRHESGSYYTPRAIVSFMGREALKGFLRARTKEEASAISLFVEDGDAFGIGNKEAVLDALKAVTICDPACGSGAYLLGAMQELLRLRQALFVSSSAQLDAVSLYERKLEIISRNLYGVDKSDFAVQIAMLRLWLSLAIEFDGPRDQIPALPNLSYKIGSGDSLASPDPLAVNDLFRAPYLEHARVLGDLHDEWMNHGIKFKRGETIRPYKTIEADMNTQSAHIQKLFGAKVPMGVFDWRLGFAEVFARGGFDIVVANPPYVRQELLGSDYKKKVLAPVHPDVANGTADLFVYFYSRALQLLKNGGVMAFISSNKWLRAGYGGKLRAHMASATHVESLTDFGDLPVFQSAIAYPMICVAQKGGAKGETLFTPVKTLGLPYPDVAAVIEANGAILPETALNGSDWQLSDAQTSARLQTMRKSGVPLGEYVKGQIFYGVKTGFNEAFVIDGATRLN